jgi:hypothetical protein
MVGLVWAVFIETLDRRLPQRMLPEGNLISRFYLIAIWPRMMFEFVVAILKNLKDPNESQGHNSKGQIPDERP